MVERLTRPKPTEEPLSVLPEGVGAVVLIGELAVLTLINSVLWPLVKGGASGVCLMEASWPIHMSQRTHPRTVPALPQLTTDTGETRSW